MVFLLACLAATAQEVTLTVEAPESAVAGERFRIIYTINSTDGQFTPPKFDPSFSVRVLSSRPAAMYSGSTET